MVQGIERMEARHREQATRRAAQDLSGVGVQVDPQPGDADAQVVFPPVAAPGDAEAQVMLPPIAAGSASPSAGPSVGTSAAVQGRLPSVPMDEEDSLPSSVGSYSPDDYAALEGVLGQCDDEPFIVAEGAPDYSMLSASERRKALAADRAAEKKRQAAQKRRAERAAKIGNGTPANRGRTPRGGSRGRRGGDRAVSVLETHAQSVPVPRSPLPSPEVAFPQLHRVLASSSRAATPPPTSQHQQQAEQPGPSTPRVDRPEPQHSEAGESSGSLEQAVAGGSSGSLGLEVAEGPGAAAVAEGQEGVEPVGAHQVPGQEAAQVAGYPLVSARHLSLPSQDLQVANLQVRLTWFFPWCLYYGGFLFRSMVWWVWSEESIRGWTRPFLVLSP